MSSRDTTTESSTVTSLLIDLIIKLPENDQLELLRELETRNIEEINQIARRPFVVRDDYTPGKYEYWDLFKT